MIRVDYVLKRTPRLSHAEFENCFCDIYGPLVAKHQTTLDIRRYVQSYTLQKDPYGEALRKDRPEMHDPCDGAATFWWHNRDNMARALETPEGKAAISELLETEQEFIDLTRSCIFLTKEIPQINPLPDNSILAKRGSPVIKLIYVLHALRGLGREGCQTWWQTRHAAIARQYGVAMGFLRYIQSHSIEDPLNEIVRQPRGTLEPYDGLTEVWFNRVELDQIMKTPDSEGVEGFGLLLEDEYKFVDISRSSTWFSKEQIFVERGL